MTGGFLGEGLSGRVGNAVLVRTATGTVLRERPLAHDAQSPAQLAQRARVARASRAWSDMEPGAVARWTAYAKGVGLRPMSAFTNLYKVLLRLDPAAPAPQVPPARAFFGDAIAIEASGSPSFHSGVRKGLGDGEREAPALSPQPPLSRAKEGEPAVLFAASGPNAPHVVTELLLQPLASRNRRTYLERYRHAAYHAFAAGETLAVPCEAGWVACAYRFVNAGTGQATALAEIGVVRA